MASALLSSDPACQPLLAQRAIFDAHQLAALAALATLKTLASDYCQF